MTAAAERTRPRLDVRDLVLIALLSAAGGVLSTYIGYLGNLVNRLFGVPFGAGQLISGLHVVWILLARALVGRFGAGTLTGLTKGAVELFTGGTHGAIIVLVSGIEGLFVDFGLGLSRRRSLALTMITGALASASNVLVFQAVYFSGVAVGFIGLMVGLALVSGAVFGGYVAWDVERLLVSSRILRSGGPAPSARSMSWWRRAAILALVLTFLAGTVYFFVEVVDLGARPGTVRVDGAVAAPQTVRITDASLTLRTVRAELRGTVTYVPPLDYTGVSLRDVVARAAPRTEATRIRVVARDGYAVSLPLAEVVAEPDILLVLEGEAVRLVVPGRDGALWVRQVVRLALE